MSHLYFWLQALPILTSVAVPIMTYLWLAKRIARYQAELGKEIEAYKIGLSKGLEHYKGDLSRELEVYKAQLQSIFQKQFYEFQTRYSLLHKERAEALATLFQLLARVEMDLQHWANWDIEPPSHRDKGRVLRQDSKAISRGH